MALVQAAGNDDADKIKELIEKGEDLESTNEVSLRPFRCPTVLRTTHLPPP